MAGYFKALRPASLRGIPFLVEGDALDFGRRIITHEFPGRDEPGHEDQGASVDRFDITAIIAGGDFLSRAEALEMAIRKPGSANLMHPHLGEISVIIHNATRSHASNAVGEIRFTIQMERYGAVQFPTSVSDTAMTLLAVSDQGFAAAIKDFKAAFQSRGLPDFVARADQAFNASIIQGFNASLKPSGMSIALPILDAFSDGFASKMVDIYKNLRDKAARPKKPVIGVIPQSPSIRPETVVKALVSAGFFKSAAGNNTICLDLFHRTCCLSAAVGAIRHMEFESREQAIDIRNRMNNHLAALRDDLGRGLSDNTINGCTHDGYDHSWQAAGLLQSACQNDINDRIGRLPKTVRIRAQAVRSSLSLAKRLYGDDPARIFDRADDIVRRNRIRHPGFVPASDMEVLIATT